MRNGHGTSSCVKIKKVSLWPGQMVKYLIFWNVWFWGDLKCHKVTIENVLILHNWIRTLKSQTTLEKIFHSDQDFQSIQLRFKVIQVQIYDEKTNLLGYATVMTSSFIKLVLKWSIIALRMALKGKANTLLHYVCALAK